MLTSLDIHLSSIAGMNGLLSSCCVLQFRVDLFPCMAFENAILIKILKLKSVVNIGRSKKSFASVPNDRLQTMQGAAIFRKGSIAANNPHTFRVLQSGVP